MIVDVDPFKVVCGVIEAQTVGGLQKLHLNNTGEKDDGITITSGKRVGIGITSPGEKLEVDGAIQIDSSDVARLKFQYNGESPHALGEIDSREDGGNGGDLQFYTKEHGGSVTEKLRINNIGAIGIGGANYGSVGAILTSNDSGAAPTWNIPTYLDGAGISDNYLIKVVGGATTQTTFRETSVEGTSTSLQTFIPDGILGFVAGTIETEFFDITNKTRMHLTSTGIANQNGITITSDGRVGIGVVEPNEVLQIDGTVRIEDNTTQTLTFYDTQGGSTKEHARIEVDDNGGGADMIFYTRPSGGNPPTEKLRINKNGIVTITGEITAQTFGPTYSVIPSLTGKIGQVVDAVDSPVNLVVNAEIEVLSITIPYTGVWLISMSLFLGNAAGLTGDIIYPTNIRINGSITHNFYGTNVTGVNGTITRNLSVNDVVAFRTYLTGSGATGMTASQRGVWFSGYTFLSATRIA
jgi:hypothetical protein